MSRRYKESRPSLSGATRMMPSYLAVFVFTLFALSLSLIIIPGRVTPANFRALSFDPPFLHWLGHVALVALTVAITGVALASTAGYALSRFRFFGLSPTLKSVLITQMFPAIILLLALSFILFELGLVNSYLRVIIIYIATALPFCIWQMKGYYDAIPLSLEEAADIDGCTRPQSFRLIVLPLATPALIITALFSFMIGWTEYVVAAIVLDDVGMLKLSPGLKVSQSHIDSQWGLYAAGALLISIPVVILFLVLSRLLVSDLHFDPVKGQPTYHSSLITHH